MGFSNSFELGFRVYRAAAWALKQSLYEAFAVVLQSLDAWFVPARVPTRFVYDLRKASGLRFWVWGF